MVEAAARARPKTATKLDEPRKFNVMFLNDSVTPMDFVIQLIHQQFHYEHARCYELMLAVHEQGQAMVATYHYEIAEQKALECIYRARQNGYPLDVKVVPA